MMRSLLWSIFIILAIVFFISVHNEKPIIISAKEARFHEKALVSGGPWKLEDGRLLDQNWEFLNDQVLDAFNIKENRVGWQFSSQRFEGDGFIDQENFKCWRQCIDKKDSRGELTLCRTEEWVWLDHDWKLVSRNIDSKYDKTFRKRVSDILDLVLKQISGE